MGITWGTFVMARASEVADENSCITNEEETKTVLTLNLQAYGKINEQ